jgi:hypothetical protein
MAMVKEVKIYYLPWVYCIAITVLRGIVCLGMLITPAISMDTDALWLRRYDLSHGFFPNAPGLSTCS